MINVGEVENGIGTYSISNGERRYRVVMKVSGRARSKGGFRTKGEARAWRDRTRADAQRGDYLDTRKGRTPFGVFAEEWLASADIRPSTRAVYRHMLDHQLACWKPMPLANITPAAIRRWVAELLATPGPRTGRVPSRAYVLKAYGLLRSLCAVAVEDGLLRSSPCNLKMGGIPKPDLHCPTYAEVMRLSAAVPERFRALVLLGGLGGLRWGEAIALRRSSVDLNEGCVRVTQAVVETVAHDVYLQDVLKTDAGRRTVYLLDPAVEALRHHLDAHCGPEEDALLFPSCGEQPYLRRGNWTNRVWRPAQLQAGVPKVRFHDLRHAAATLAAQHGFKTADLMAHIGHANHDAAMRYQHSAEQRTKGLVRAMSASLAATAC